MTTAEIPSHKRRVLAHVTAGAYALAFFALAISGVALWRMYCEGFGCVGKGIAWFAWAMGFMAALALGHVARRAHYGAWRTGVGRLLGVQMAAGIALFVSWAVRQAT